MSFIRRIGTARRFWRQRRLPAAALVAALALLLTSPGWAQDWTYTVRPGDSLWELANRYLNPNIGWQRLQEHNRVDDPRHLAPGSTLRFPIAWLRVQPAGARVVAVHGRVLGHRADGSEPFAVERDMELGVGVRLSTQEDANLTLQFADGSRLLIHGDSEVTLDSLSAYGTTGMVDTRMRLQRGRASGRVIERKGPGSRFVIETPAATTSVRGTEFRVASGDDGTRAVTEVLTGEVAVRGGERDVTVPAGYGTIVEAADAAPVVPLPLLPAPRLRDLPATVDRIPFELTWPELAGAERYRLQIAPDRWFTTLLHDAIVDGPRAAVADLPDGEFVVRVRGIDRHGLEGEDGEHALTVDARPRPPFAVAPHEGDVVRDPRPRYRWTLSQSAVGYRFQLARDAAFEDLLVELTGLVGDSVRPVDALEPGDYFWRIGARSADGELGPFGDPLGFTFRRQPPSPRLEPPELGRKGITFRWAEGDRRRSYRFQLARSPDFAEPRIDRQVDAPEITLPRLRPGTWYMRAQALDPDGFAGPFSDTQTIDVPCRACRVTAGAIIVLILLAL